LAGRIVMDCSPMDRLEDGRAILPNSKLNTTESKVE